MRCQDCFLFRQWRENKIKRCILPNNLIQETSECFLSEKSTSELDSSLASRVCLYFSHIDESFIYRGSFVACRLHDMSWNINVILYLRYLLVLFGSEELTDCLCYYIHSYWHVKQSCEMYHLHIWCMLFNTHRTV